jgi:hypothetical protein
MKPHAALVRHELNQRQILQSYILLEGSAMDRIVRVFMIGVSSQ